MSTRADHLDPVGTILSTHLVILPDPTTGKLYRSTVGALLAMVAPPDLSLKADLVSGKVPASQLPSYVDDVLEFDTVALLPIIGETGKLYVITTGADAEDVFRWTGTVYLQVGGRDFGVDISTEASTRAAADIALQNNIDAEATTRAAADTTLQTNITTEASTRAAADTTLQNNIDSEALARGNQDTVLLGLINAEANTRSTNDNTLSSNISSEATARAAADITLQTNIDLKLNIADYNDRYKGKFTSLIALQTAHPTASAGDYAQVDIGATHDVKNYNYDLEDGWIEGGSGSAAVNTDGLPEGTTNLYFTTARAIAAIDLSGKVDKNSPITGAAKTKITYDAKGLVTSGADATTTDIGEGTNLYFTSARALAVALAGFVSATGTVTSADSILTALQKLAGNHDAVSSTVNQKILSIAGNYSQSIM